MGLLAAALCAAALAAAPQRQSNYVAPGQEALQELTIAELKGSLLEANLTIVELKLEVAQLKEELLSAYKDLASSGSEAYEHSSEAVGKRRLANMSLRYLCAAADVSNSSEAAALAKAQLETAELGAMGAAQEARCSVRHVFVVGGGAAPAHLWRRDAFTSTSPGIRPIGESRFGL